MTRSADAAFTYACDSRHSGISVGVKLQTLHCVRRQKSCNARCFFTRSVVREKRSNSVLFCKDEAVFCSVLLSKLWIGATPLKPPIPGTLVASLGGQSPVPRRRGLLEVYQHHGAQGERVSPKSHVRRHKHACMIFLHKRSRQPPNVFINTCSRTSNTCCVWQ